MARQAAKEISTSCKPNETNTPAFNGCETEGNGMLNSRVDTSTVGIGNSLQLLKARGFPILSYWVDKAYSSQVYPPPNCLCLSADKCGATLANGYQH